jgi:hypothetical protein
VAMSEAVYTASPPPTSPPPAAGTTRPAGRFCSRVFLDAHRVGRGRHCTIRHWLPFDSGNEGYESVYTTWRAMGMADIVRNVIGCHLKK